MPQKLFFSFYCSLLHIVMHKLSLVNALRIFNGVDAKLTKGNVVVKDGFITKILSKQCHHRKMLWLSGVTIEYCHLALLTYMHIYLSNIPFRRNFFIP